MTTRAYLAGPDVFLHDALEFAEIKKGLCARYGIEGVFPLDAVLDLKGLSSAEAAYRISAANEGLIRSCQLVIANMTPFRGVSADVGTAFEMGFARALGLSVYAYSNDTRSFTARARMAFRFNEDLKGNLRDENRMLLEEFSPLSDNLMLDGAVWSSSGTTVFTPRGVPVVDPFRDLTAFEMCLKHAAGVQGL
jgi:nucleoside 2-deoxyribosyltransferase